MKTTAGSTYLRETVFSASPEQLQLMLYDGAIKFARQGRDAIAANRIEDSFNLLTRAQRIVQEMQNGLRPEVHPEICRQMSALHLFINRKLVEANVQKDLQALDDALKILTMMRDTWSMLLDNLQPHRGRSDHSTAPSPDSGGLCLDG